MEPNSPEDGARGPSTPLNNINDENPSDIASFSNEHLPTDQNNVYIDAKPGTSKSWSRVNGEESFSPEPSTSSKKTDMEKMLEEMSSPTSDTNTQEKPTAQESKPNDDKPNNFFNYYGGWNGGSTFQYKEPPKKKYANSDEYFTDLREWLQQAYFWQSVTAAFPYFMMCQFGQMSLQSSAAPATNLGMDGVAPLQFPFQLPGMQYQRQEPQRVSREVVEGVECRIPSFWKRIVAEFIDFLLLFVVKIVVTYIAVDFLHFVEVDTFDLFQKDTKIAYKTFLQITQDIVILEIIHRLVVCAFETFWLSGGNNGRVGGSTPGKHLMGLRVITCDSSSPVAERNSERVVVKPGTNLGLGTSLLRALTKNFVLALLIPTSFAFIFFPHNRTGYDMICNTIVVEEPITPHRVRRD